MPRAQRLDDVTCVICMDSLFNQRDDLDEVSPIATPDCGHVFHERCLIGWFDTQAQQYVANAREYGWGGERGGSPSASDAAAECPTCRAECFADAETGKPIIHRLFINFDNEDGGGAGPSSSVAGSSPIKFLGSTAPIKRGPSSSSAAVAGARDGEVFRLARRARGLEAEVKDLNPDSQEEDVDAMVKRAESLKDDVASVKAIQGFKTYIGGLTTAINSFRVQLLDHPLSTTLQERLRKAKLEARDLRQKNADLLQTFIPAEVEKAVKREQDHTAPIIKQLQKDFERVTRELNREKVNRQAANKEHEHRMHAQEQQLHQAQRQLAAEQEAHKATQETLSNRNRSLKMYQSKVESRKALKAKMKELEDEIQRLQGLTGGTSGEALRRESPSSPWRDADAPDSDDEGRHDSFMVVDDSIQEIGSDAFAHTQAFSGLVASSSRHQVYDDSLEVDMPSFNDKSHTTLPVPSTPAAAQPAVRPATVRTYSSTMFEDLAPAAGPSRHGGKTKTSKHFPHTSAQRVPQEFDLSDDDSAVVGGYPRPADQSPSAAPRKRTNPWAVTKTQSDQRKRLCAPASDRRSDPSAITRPSPIDLTGSPGPDSPSPLEDGSSRMNAAASTSTTARTSKAGKQTTSLVDQLGIRDAQGRPVKGLVSGTRARRRA